MSVVAQLQASMAQWEVQQQEAARALQVRLQAQRAQELRQQQEQQRSAAAQREEREERERELQAASKKQPGLFSSLLRAAAIGYMANEVGLDPGTAVMTDLQDQKSSTNSRSESIDADAYGGESCRNDPALVARVQSILENCDGVGICTDARAHAACYARMAAEAGSCASVVNQARDLTAAIRGAGSCSMSMTAVRKGLWRVPAWVAATWLGLLAAASIAQTTLPPAVQADVFEDQDRRCACSETP